MKITVKFAAALMTVCMASSLLAGNLDYVSNGPIVPGEWNSNYYAGKEYADANHIPLVLFWASSGCGQCKALETACNKPDFVAWRQSRQFVMIFVENDQTIYRLARSTGQYPTCLAYWSKADGTVISQTFCGRTSAMNVAGSTQGEKFMNKLDSIFATQGQPVASTGSAAGSQAGATATVGAEWNRTRNLKAGLFAQGTGRFGGTVLLKTGRANKSSKKARVTPKVTALTGKGRNFSPVTASVDATTSVSAVNKWGTLNLTVTGDNLGGTYTDEYGTVYDVKPVTVGGAPANGNLVFKLETYPTTINGMEVLTQYLPLSTAFSAANNRWRFASRSSLRFSVAEDQFVPTSLANPSSLKLSYKIGTGFFRGSCKFYALKNARSARGYNTTVTGYMLGSEGVGVVTLKGVGTYNCSISAQ